MHQIIFFPYLPFLPAVEYWHLFNLVSQMLLLLLRGTEVATQVNQFLKKLLHNYLSSSSCWLDWFFYVCLGVFLFVFYMHILALLDFKTVKQVRNFLLAFYVLYVSVLCVMFCTNMHKHEIITFC